MQTQDDSNYSHLNLPGAVKDSKKKIKVRKGTDVPCVIVLFNKVQEVHFVSLAQWVVDYEQACKQNERDTQMTTRFLCK